MEQKKQPQAPDEEIRARSESGSTPEQPNASREDEGAGDAAQEEAMEKVQEKAADEREDSRGYQ